MRRREPKPDPVPPPKEKDHEALETGAVVRELARAVEHEVDDLLADGVVATGVVVGGVLLAGDELLGVVEVAVGSGADLVHAGGLEVDHQAAGDELPGAGLGEEGVEGVILDGSALWLLAVGLDAVLEAEEFPAGVTNLDTSLTDVDGDDFTHDVKKVVLFFSSFLSKSLERLDFFLK